MSATLTGLADLERRVALLTSDLATKVGQSANRAGAKKYSDLLKAAVPVGPTPEGAVRLRRRKSGTVRREIHHKLRNSIRIKKIRSDHIHKVVNAVTVGKAYHAAFIEFGSIHNPPNPVMRKTLEDNQQAIIDEMAKVLNKRLVKAGV